MNHRAGGQLENFFVKMNQPCLPSDIQQMSFTLSEILEKRSTLETSQLRSFLRAQKSRKCCLVKKTLPRNCSIRESQLKSCQLKKKKVSNNARVGGTLVLQLESSLNPILPQCQVCNALDSLMHSSYVCAISNGLKKTVSLELVSNVCCQQTTPDWYD